MNFKKTLLVTLLASGVLANPSMALAEQNQTSGMEYVEGTEETVSDNTNPMVESRSQEQVSLDEGIAAEQIIVKITDEGYVTSHGDHYHYYNGEVPEDSIFLVNLVTEEKLDSFEKVSEIEKGWIVKKADQYFVWLEAGKSANQVRSIEELTLQANGIDPKDAKAIVELKKEYQLTDDSLIIPAVDKTPEEVIKEEKFEGQPIVVYITEKEFVLLMGIDFYVFSGEVAEDAYFSELLLAPKEYQFKEADVKQAIKDGFIVKIKDQYKVYQEKANDRIVAIKTINEEVKTSFAEIQKNDKEHREHREKANQVKDGELLGGSGSRNSSGSYVTSDGYVFSPYDVIQDLGDGFIVPHENHFHFIPKSDLTPAELKIALAVLGKTQANNDRQPVSGDNSTSNKPSNGNHSNQSDSNVIVVKPVDTDKPYTTSDGYTFTVESITKVERQGVIAKHGNHYHWVPFSDLNKKELQAAKKYIKENFGIDIALADEVANEEKPTSVTAPFDSKAVLRKETINGKVGYVFLANQKEVFKAIDELDYQAISFAEQQLNINEGLQYKYEVAKANEGEIEPGLYVPLSQLPMHVGSATLDTGESFIVPHIDHIHIVYYNNLTKEQIATVKYLMQHPEYRPAPWTEEGHSNTVSTEFTYVPNVTPESERAGLKNWQIVHSVEEVNAALAKGIYATDEGYIFSVEDLKDSATFIWNNGTFTIPKKNGKQFFTLDSNKLPADIKAEADKIIQERQAQKQKELEEAAAKPEKEITNMQLIEFLAKHYNTPKLAVRYQINQESFKVYYTDFDFIIVDKETAIAAYQNKGSLPKLPKAVQTEMDTTTSVETSETTEKIEQTEQTDAETTIAETSTEVIETTVSETSTEDIETTVAETTAPSVEVTTSVEPTTTEMPMTTEPEE